MIGESNQNVFLIQIDALEFAEFEFSEFEISRFDCIFFNAEFTKRHNLFQTTPVEVTGTLSYISYETIIIKRLQRFPP